MNNRCPAEGVMRFNTQVAIGDKGELLAKYHKTHRYLASSCVGDGLHHQHLAAPAPPAVPAHVVAASSSPQ